MEANWERTGGIATAKPEGRIDATNAEAFQAALSAGLAPDDRGVILDLGGITYISSAGLRAILVVAKTLKARNAGIAICSF